MSTKYWCGEAPTHCDLCGAPIEDSFIDGKTRMGPWGNLDPICHARIGVGLGTGRGQRYVRDVIGRWAKVEG